MKEQQPGLEMMVDTQLGGTAVTHLYLDASLLAETLEDRRDQLLASARVHGDGALVVPAAGGEERGGDEHQRKGGAEG